MNRTLFYFFVIIDLSDSFETNFTCVMLLIKKQNIYINYYINNNCDHSKMYLTLNLVFSSNKTMFIGHGSGHYGVLCYHYESESNDKLFR